MWWSLTSSCGTFAPVGEFSTIDSLLLIIFEVLMSLAGSFKPLKDMTCVCESGLFTWIVSTFLCVFVAFSPTLEQNLIFACCSRQQRNTQPRCGVAADELVALQLAVTNPWWSECEVAESSCSWFLYQTLLVHYHQSRNFIWECWFW